MYSKLSDFLAFTSKIAKILKLWYGAVLFKLFWFRSALSQIFAYHSPSIEINISRTYNQDLVKSELEHKGKPFFPEKRLNWVVC